MHEVLRESYQHTREANGANQTGGECPLWADVICVLVDGWAGWYKRYGLRKPARVQNCHLTLSEGMYDKREHESVRRRRKLADLFARKPGQCDNGAVERFANEDDFVPAGYARYHRLQIRVVETNRVLTSAGW
jgi:hypothetical protein